MMSTVGSRANANDFGRNAGRSIARWYETTGRRGRSIVMADPQARRLSTDQMRMVHPKPTLSSSAPSSRGKTNPPIPVPLKMTPVASLANQQSITDVNVPSALDKPLGEPNNDESVLHGSCYPGQHPLQENEAHDVCRERRGEHGDKVDGSSGPDDAL